MHRHFHHHHHGPGKDHHHDHDHDHGGPGHNHPGSGPVQWQTPHLPHHHHEGEAEETEPDIDLVETSFIEGFSTASDPTNFLRLAGIPLEAEAKDGKRLCLLRVELDQRTDIGSITPHIGGQTYRYDPLPTRMISRRKGLQFIYHDGSELVPLSFAKARALAT